MFFDVVAAVGPVTGETGRVQRIVEERWIADGLRCTCAANSGMIKAVTDIIRHKGV
jgi:hypothetical protein